MQLVWQPYLSKTRLLCVRNSRGGPSINTRGTPGAAVCLPQEPLYLVGGSDSLRHLGGGRRGGLGCTWPRVPGGGSGGWESDREQGSGLGPNPHSQPSAGRRGSGPWVCCLPALKGEAGTDVSLNQKITLAPRWAALWRCVPPPQLCAKVCLSGEQQRVAGGGCGTSKAPSTPSPPTGLPTRMSAEGLPPMTKATPPPWPSHVLLPSPPCCAQKG